MDTEELKNFISNVVELASLDLERLVHHLTEEYGCKKVGDLKYVAESEFNDLTLIQRRKLKAAITNYLGNECSNEVATNIMKWSKSEKRKLLQLYWMYNREAPLYAESYSRWNNIAGEMNHHFLKKFTGKQCMDKIRDYSLALLSMQRSVTTGMWREIGSAFTCNIEPRPLPSSPRLTKSQTSLVSSSNQSMDSQRSETLALVANAVAEVPNILSSWFRWLTSSLGKPAAECPPGTTRTLMLQASSGTTKYTSITEYTSCTREASSITNEIKRKFDQISIEYSSNESTRDDSSIINELKRKFDQISVECSPNESKECDGSKRFNHE